MNAIELARRLSSEGHLQAMYRAVEPAYPHEGCGFVFETLEGALSVIAVANRAQELYLRDPERYPRGGGDWFEPDMKPWFRAVREGLVPRVIFHSHPDEGAYFSQGDHDSAVFVEEDGSVHERNPGVWHLVVSVRAGVADGASLFEFDPAGARFCCVARFDGDGRIRGEG